MIRSRFLGAVALCLAIGVVTAFVERSMDDSLFVLAAGALIAGVVAWVVDGLHPFSGVWWFCVANAPTFIILYYG